jgi:hypothetical protein
MVHCRVLKNIYLATNYSNQALTPLTFYLSFVTIFSPATARLPKRSLLSIFD